MLYIVATPIGNLNDISFRAIEVLKNVDLILAEDTRHSKKLLQNYNIKTKMQAFHEHNEKLFAKKIIKQCKTLNIALISDAGTPLISDPGYVLVSLAKQNNIEVVPVPGASAIIAALSVAGLPSDSFSFFGFVPTKNSTKMQFINNLNSSKITSICYESPKRILATIGIMQKIFADDRLICLAKELTKNFETIITATADKLLDYLQSDEKHQRGEFVILVSPNLLDNDKTQQLTKILPILSQELPKSTAAKIAAKITGLNKKEIYEKLL